MLIVPQNSNVESLFMLSSAGEYLCIEVVDQSRALLDSTTLDGDRQYSLSILYIVLQHVILIKPQRFLKKLRESVMTVKQYTAPLSWQF